MMVQRFVITCMTFMLEMALTGIEMWCCFLLLPVEGAIPSLSKDTAASSVRPSQASASLKRPVPEPKGGPAKRSKGGKTHTHLRQECTLHSVLSKTSELTRSKPTELCAHTNKSNVYLVRY